MISSSSTFASTTSKPNREPLFKRGISLRLKKTRAPAGTAPCGMEKNRKDESWRRPDLVVAPACVNERESMGAMASLEHHFGRRQVTFTRNDASLVTRQIGRELTLVDDPEFYSLGISDAYIRRLTMADDDDSAYFEKIAMDHMRRQAQAQG